MNGFNFYVLKKLSHSIICQLPCRKPTPVKIIASNFPPLTFSKIKVFHYGRKFQIINEQ